ncbi:LLM class F420-dependent oxidoreductase [Emcibacter sp. SYSU 3D8]|uniref:LLM class F420-dependent oxidoreductase n=1 Tax=Emcibacter sp. SYSU 3D8 TaxID=3133969 RepID=UPI0031FEEEC3
MKLGYYAINTGPTARPDTIAAILRCAEDAGFESAWTGEHVVAIDPQAPPSPIPPDLPIIDTIASLAFAAAVTTRLKLGSGIILLAQRNPVILAKELAGVDVLSNGRLLFGVGVGYVKGEFDAIGVPYSERGARVDDHIEAIRALWTQDRPSFDGRFTKFANIQSKPMPVQTPHPPIIIGGMSEAGYRRAIRHGDGWFGFGQTEEDVAASLAGLKSAAAEAGRPERFDALEISVTPRGPVDADRIRRFEDMGVHRLVLMPAMSGGKAGSLDGIRRFIEDTAPLAPSTS